MSLSSSSNAEPPSGPTFKVTSRALTADLATASVGETARELGSFTSAGLTELLVRLTALDPAKFADADPQLLVSARRGRFVVKPGNSRLLLRSAGEPDATYFELPAEQVAEFLSGHDSVPMPMGTTQDLPADMPAVRRRSTPLAAVLFVVTALVVAGSAAVTIKRPQVDPASAYEKLSDAREAAAARQQAIGNYSAGDGPRPRSIEVAENGMLTYREPAPGLAAPDERSGAFAVMRRRSDRATILRVERFGPIEAKTDGTLFYAGEIYRRAANSPKRAAP